MCSEDISHFVPDSRLKYSVGRHYFKWQFLSYFTLIVMYILQLSDNIYINDNYIYVVLATYLDGIFPKRDVQADVRDQALTFTS